MRDRTIWRVCLATLVAVVGAFLGVVLTGLAIGIESEVSQRVLQVGSPLLSITTVMLVVVGLLYVRARRGDRDA